MLTCLLLVSVLGLCGKLISVAFKASWGILKVLFGIILLPLTIVGLIISGIFYLAIPLLIIGGIVALFAPKRVL